MTQGNDIIQNTSSQRWMEDELAHLKEREQLRTLHPTLLLPNGWLERKGRRLLNLASNDYLGLASESAESNKTLQVSRSDRTRLEAVHASHRMRSNIDEVSWDSNVHAESPFAAVQPAGSAASRLVTGHSPVYEAFEDAFATYKGTESCLLFSNGYMANTGVIPSLVGRHDVVFSDRLNHASIVDGCILSRAEVKRYKHRDLNHLEQLLKKTKPQQMKLIITDSVFSMDGTLAPLEDLVKLKERYGAVLMVDEAHSGGIYGAEGQGLVHQLKLSDRVDVQMGTFSKAYGSYGAYIAGTHTLKQYLINKARSLIYSTALPPTVIQQLYLHWQRVRQDAWRRERLFTLSEWMRNKLRSEGFHLGGSECHILPIIVGSNETALEFSAQLRNQGIAAVAIRPPTVPQGQARIRISLMATHKTEDLGWAVDILTKTARRLGVIG